MAKVDPQSIISNASTSSLLADLSETLPSESGSYSYNAAARSVLRSKKLKTQLYDMYNKENNIPRIYKETLRAMIHLFSELAVLDSEEKLVTVKCMHGNPERVVAKLKQEDNIILPIITVTQTTSDNDDNRRRYSPTIINERYWDTDKQRAFRLLSFVPRPININYEVNIWCKYMADADQILEQIRIKFNPEADINTPYSTRTKAFINSEEDKSSLIAADAVDRVVRKTVIVTVQSYVPSPKFLFTSTGKIEKFNFESSVYKN